MSDLRAATARALAGGPERHHSKAREQGKLPVRERIAALVDDDSFAEEALLLFVTVAKLRAREPRAGARGCRRTDARQPTGKANYVLFLELQRRMAAKAGVQLVVS